MSTYTPNYNLEKPDAGDDFGDFRANYNSNMDIIDANLGGGGGGSASDVTYDNTSSGLTATNVQDAIDEVVGDIPTVNDGTLTIQKNGTTIDTFTANSASNKTVNVTVPTATSDLSNDSDFVSDASYVHTDNNFTSALLTKLNGIESGAEVNVQSDWNEADNTADDYIKNKPSLATVATTGDYDDLINKPTIPTYTAGGGIDITSNVISLEYLKVVNGAVNLVFDDGN